jgi:hypothetical protein
LFAWSTPVCVEVCDHDACVREEGRELARRGDVYGLRHPYVWVGYDVG